MKSTLIIVADLGLLRSYRQIKGSQGHHPHLQLIAELKPAAAHEKYAEQVSDQAGRFARGGGTGGASGDLSSGESLHQEGEQEHRLIQRLADAIDGLLADGEVKECLLAVSAPIHHQLFDALKPKTRGKIRQVLASNLAKTDPTELLAHFEKAARLSTKAS